MRKKAVQQGRSERRGESYSGPYVEPLSDARTPVAVFFRILLEPLSCRKIAEGKDTKDSHNAQHGCPRKRIVKPLE